MAVFLCDLRKLVIQLLQSYGVNYRDKMELHELLTRYYTFMGKYIVPAKRAVLISKELIMTMPNMPKLVQEAIQKLTEWIIDGKDINCFQSRGLYGHGSRDYQNILYGIVHLHLSAKKEDTTPQIKNNGFAKPSKYILYAYFTEDHAYLIKAEIHPDNDDIGFKKWISTELLEIIVNNWPYLVRNRELKACELCDKEGRPIQLDDDAIAVLTKAHCNTAIRIGDKLYLPEYGLAGSGDSAFAGINANRIINATTAAQLYYDENSEFIHEKMVQRLKEEHKPIPDKFDIHYFFHPIQNRFVIAALNANLAWDDQLGVFNLFPLVLQST